MQSYPADEAIKSVGAALREVGAEAVAPNVGHVVLVW